MKIKVEVEDIEVKKILSDIMNMGCTPIIKYQPEKPFEELSTEDVKEMIVIVPSEKESIDEKGSNCVKVGDIDIEKSNENWLSCKNKEQYIIVAPEILNNLLFLKLYSEGYGIITDEDFSS
ncbi:hypothetical protein [Chryseobacterium limigenitum]|uniref:Uncharacterized protein n=1 Tax=Chryseobacterium limigenitum TaxID=1612149 RepID=A0A1K2IGJ4_9FLAO|nr:hypothetical protein [Chryseobacterium limigenitum]SFZ91557.1 hypothetical protein SAMN05216324_102409 [Chryseobacterium limigenitum]